MIPNLPARALTLLAVLATPAQAVCPDASEILAQVTAAGPERGARTTRFGMAVPEELYREAADDIGETFVSREGKRGFAVTVARLPVEMLWMALNDEDAHDLEGDYLPLEHSEVIGGTPRGSTRLLFQYAKKMGVGRWWVSRVSADRELYLASQGRLWQVVWQEDLGAVDPHKPPISEASSRMPAISLTRGAWLLVPLAQDCTLVEHFSHNDPGGAVETIQFLVMSKALRDTVQGMVRLAQDHYTPADAASFTKPDGSPLR